MASAATCTNQVTGSNFEIDPNANLTVQTDGCIDWLDGSAFRGVKQQDKPTGAGDDSFGQGTAENDTTPTIVSGSIPPNKSDLKYFGVNTETAAGKFLQLFWTRVQNPSGTTNMDFELNQKFCDPAATPTNCANNGKDVTPETPIRTSGDKLVTYDLSKGGTVPTISIRTWSGSVWGSPTVISATSASAVGSVNTTAILAANSGGLGALDAYTFGEASIAFTALFPAGSGCTTLGSAYLKSRSSDSFTAEIKDFISPERVSISNCTGLVTSATQQVVVGSAISDTATLTGATEPAGGTMTFRLYSDSACSTLVATLDPVPVGGNGNYSSGNYTPVAVGTYYWIASYSGDLNNGASTGVCGDSNETSIVTKASPAISTTATAGPVIVGATISDTAALSSATSTAGGSISFALYSDSICSTLVTTLGPVAVTGNGSYGSGNYLTTAVGTYFWIASYTGDANNNAVAGTCGDTGESSQVTKQQPAISTTAVTPVVIGAALSDSAVLTGATSDAGGSISFKLYSNDTCTTLVTTLGPVSVSGNGTYPSGSYTPSAVGTYYWVASYTGDVKNEAVSGACKDTGETSVVNKAPADIATAQSFYPQDSVTMSASAGGTPTGSVTFKLFGPNAADCSGTAAYTRSGVALVSGAADTNNQSTFAINAASAGSYKWLVSYSGDANHLANAGVCGDETSSLSINNNAIP
ncbi:MAG: hypothetical protein ABI336_12270 [Humibacillus sp.]